MILHALSSPWSYRLGWTLIHSLWEGAAIAAGLWILLEVMRRRSAQARYWVSTGALALIFAAACVTFMLIAPPPPHFTGAMHLSSATPIPSPIRASDGRMVARSPGAPLAAPDPDRETARRWPATGREVARAALPWAVAAWMIGVLLLGIWRIGGWVAAQRLRVLGVNPAGAALAAKADELARRLGLRGAVTVFESFLVQTPVVIGWLQPVVLIPAAVLTGLTPAQLEAILVHELAHIRRQDYLINAMQTLAETLLFYHPLRQVQAQHKVGVALTSDVYEATRDAAEARAELAEAKGDKPLEAKELNAAVDAARKLVDIQRKRFEAGQLTGVDVLRSQRELTDLQVRLARLSPEAGEP